MDRQSEINSVLKQVHDWPADDQEALAMELLRSSRRPKSSDVLSGARGLFKTEGPAPTDEQVEQILEEARLEKYGR